MRIFTKPTLLTMKESCIICGKRKVVPIWREGDKQIVRCLTCGFYLHYPKVQLPEYEIDYHQGRLKTNHDRNLYIERTNQILKFQKEGDLLDVGCGFGEFIKFSQSVGYTVTGLEISKFAADIARKSTSSPIVTSPIARTNFQPNSFDVITMWHVLEHIDDPIDTLNIIKTWLKPSGLLVLELPNEFNSLVGRLSAIRRGYPVPYTHPPVHLWFFNPSTITSLILQSGFQILCVNTFKFVASNEFYQKYWALKYGAPIIDWIVYKANLGSLIRVFARVIS
jgi:2-polyprenyl-3-methyl-5-hydroxy-6-metoxy-1,4-benzoquinol methylase